MTISLDHITDSLARIAPLQLAEAWDNVGLLLAPSKPRPIHRILLTIDLTEAVVDEAIESKIAMVVAYHPPIFRPLERLTGDIHLVRLIERRIAVYSPHTALDAVEGGVNDWLADGLGEGSRQPIQSHANRDLRQTHKVVVFVPADSADPLREAMSGAGAGVIGNYDHCSFNLPGFGTFRGDESTNPAVGRRGRLEKVEEVRMEMICSGDKLGRVARAIRDTHPYEEPAWEVTPLVEQPSLTVGQGRDVTLKEPVPLGTIVRRVKKHLGLKYVRIAASHNGGDKISRIALCAGAGGSVLRGNTADLYLTGEMRHHDILAANAAGTSVILTDHTHTERGYLPILQQKLTEQLGPSVQIDLSQNDAEPLRIM